MDIFQQVAERLRAEFAPNLRLDVGVTVAVDTNLGAARRRDPPQ